MTPRILICAWAIGASSGDDVVREPVRMLIPKALYAVCIPSHDNVGQQSQGSGDGLHLLGRPAVPGADGSGLNGSLQAL